MSYDRNQPMYAQYASKLATVEYRKNLSKSRI